MLIYITAVSAFGRYNIVYQISEMIAKKDFFQRGQNMNIMIMY